jgi:hypothetical protein
MRCDTSLAAGNDGELSHATGVASHSTYTKRLCFLNFPYVCPEPILANDRF